MKSRSYKRNLK